MVGHGGAEFHGDGILPCPLEGFTYPCLVVHGLQVMGCPTDDRKATGFRSINPAN